MSSNLVDLPLDQPADLPHPQYWHLVVKMSSNLVDLPLDQPADLPPPPVLASSGQDEFKFGSSTPRSTGRSTPWVIEQRCLEYQYTKIGRWTYFGQWTPQSIKNRCLEHCYTKLGRWTYFGQWTAPAVLTSSGQDEFKFGRSTPRSAGRSTPWYWHLVVNNGNFTLLLTSTGQEWQFHIATDIEWSTMAISHCYWHLVDKNGNFTLLLTSSGQEWQFHIATDI